MAAVKEAMQEWSVAVMVAKVVTTVEMESQAVAKGAAAREGGATAVVRGAAARAAAAREEKATVAARMAVEAWGALWAGEKAAD